jgi:hypothetical protein
LAVIKKYHVAKTGRMKRSSFGAKRWFVSICFLYNKANIGILPTKAISVCIYKKIVPTTPHHAVVENRTFLHRAALKHHR